MERWIEAYPGGWQLLLPNGGDECTEQGVTWGFHGEAALVPWTVLDQSGLHGHVGDLAFYRPPARAPRTKPGRAGAAGAGNGNERF